MKKLLVLIALLPIVAMAASREQVRFLSICCNMDGTGGDNAK